ncbi:MAG: DUF134 domain-containing protein [Nitrospirae bacterium]|nr:DUF134 domain-containing protein [Nitrospirota bacterium]
MSPRYKKPRTCGCTFKGKAFKPIGIPLAEIEKIMIYPDELESLKLCDLDGLSQEEAGRTMGISRGTVQRILAGARQKTACALTQCKALVLEKSVCNKGEKK